MSASKWSRTARPNRVLAQRNQAVVAVGAWVECGHDFVEHPAIVASLTDEWQDKRRREDEENLRRFQQEVRHRVARISKSKTPQPVDAVRADSRVSPLRLSSALEDNDMACDAGRQVRLRLAACRMIPQDREVTSELPGGRWNVCKSRHREAEQQQHDEEEEEEEEEEEDDDLQDDPLSRQHICPLFQYNGSEQTTESRSPPSRPTSVGRHAWDSDRDARQVFRPPGDQEEARRQRQSHFLLQRRQIMRLERERAKEDNLHRKHLRRTARMKAEKEQTRLDEERRLERERRLAALREALEQREILVLEQLKLEEKDRNAEMDRTQRRHWRTETESARSIEALRARMKQHLSREKLDLPPLCCCASSFWDSHPDTCANNCIFHNNPKAYIQALLSLMASLDSS